MAKYRMVVVRKKWCYKLGGRGGGGANRGGRGTLFYAIAKGKMKLEWVKTEKYRMVVRRKNVVLVEMEAVMIVDEVATLVEDSSSVSEGS